MVKIDVYNQAGAKTGTKELNTQIFHAEVNEGLMHQALVRQQANARYNLAAVKNKGEVRGGGRKPYAQKGTGRARQGSIRAPQWRGGGIIFGPTGTETYSLLMPKKQRRVALFSALTVKANEKAIFALESYKGEISTKALAELVAKLPVERNLLVVLGQKNAVLEKSARNIPNVKTILASYLNIADLMKYRAVCLVEGADKNIEEVFLNNN